MIAVYPNDDTLARQAPVNWLDAAVTIFDLVSEMSAFIRGFGMNSEYVPLFALLLLAGGVTFWFGVVFLFFVGAFRLVRKGVWAVMDLVTPEPAIELPEVVLPHTE